MKRFLHALAALWPKRKEVGNLPTPPTSTGLRQHLAAVLRMERALCGFADSPIRGFAEETVGASALSTVRDQLPESPDTRLVDSPDTRLPESSTQQLTESPDTRLIESPDTRLDDSPNQQFVDSPNQPQSLPRIPQPMPLLTILMLVFFMCLMAAKQVSAQAEPAEAADHRISKSFFDDILRDAESQYGILGVHEFEDKIYLEIPDSLLGRDILAVNRLAKGWAGEKPFDPFLNYIGFSGDLTGETLFRIDEYVEGKLGILKIDYSDRIIINGVTPILPPNADLPAILHTFNVISRNQSDNAFLVDGTEFLNGDNEVMTFSKPMRKKYGVSSMNSQQSSIVGIEATDNHLITSKEASFGYRNGETIRMKIRSTWFVLTEKPYPIREFNSQVGYYSQQIKTFNAPFSAPKNLRMIKRWRMEPNAHDEEAYFRGELVAPRKPIVIYIDSEMPEAWVPYMLDGINEWQQAFEQAGFKNAIRGEHMSKEMANQLVGDARYSMISYKPSSIANATAELVIDPRSGEIVNVHIAIHHGVLRMLQKWLLIQGVAKGQKDGVSHDQWLTGRMIQSLVAHEVGHSLGLLHNFGASSTVPIEKLRDANWLSTNPISPSIMDYVRVNYVAQPEDSIRTEDIFPRVGAYDKWAIEWGYRYTGENGWIEAVEFPNRIELESSLWYGAQNEVDDPRCQAEDLSGDPVAAASYGIKNLRRSAVDNVYRIQEAEKLDQIYQDLFEQHSHYIRHATIALNGSPPKRPAALAFLNTNFFQFPEWPEPYQGSDWDQHIKTTFNSLQKEILPQIFAHLLSQQDIVRLTEVQNMIFDDRKPSKTNSVYKRQLQWNYVSNLNMLTKQDVSNNLATTYENYLTLMILRNQLLDRIHGLKERTSDDLMSVHLERVKAALTDH